LRSKVTGCAAITEDCWRYRESRLGWPSNSVVHECRFAVLERSCTARHDPRPRVSRRTAQRSIAPMQGCAYRRRNATYVAHARVVARVDGAGVLRTADTRAQQSAAAGTTAGAARRARNGGRRAPRPPPPSHTAGRPLARLPSLRGAAVATRRRPHGGPRTEGEEKAAPRRGRGRGRTPTSSIGWSDM
jgi:hypothetical protein